MSRSIINYGSLDDITTPTTTWQRMSQNRRSVILAHEREHSGIEFYNPHHVPSMIGSCVILPKVVVWEHTDPDDCDEYVFKGTV